MKKVLLSAALLFLFSTSQAHAFLFTDVAAYAQRVAMIAQAAQYIQQLNNYRAEFDRYKGVFDDYFNRFRLVYRRLSAADWQDFLPSDWVTLKDHFITIWKTFDEGLWQSQVISLRTTPLYRVNADFRTYAESLINFSDQQIQQLKKEEASLIDLEKQDAQHYEDLQRFKSRNELLAVGQGENNEIALSQQVALTNAILIELASIQAEIKVVEQRLLTDQKEQRNLIMRMKQLEIDAQNGDFANLDYLKTLTQTK
jgi:hypothetical protein